MVLHGLWHFIGFIQEWHPEAQAQLMVQTVNDLTGSTSKLSSGLWLIPFVLLFISAVLYLLHRDFYWILAFAGIAVSQVLVIRFWDDAKYGTIINAVLLILVTFFTAPRFFNAMARREVDELIAHAVKGDRFITPEMIAALPQTVQRWLNHAGVVGKKTSNILRVVQEGVLRTRPDGQWMPFQSVQYFSTNPPAFVWVARIKPVPLFHIAGRDKYHLGRGHMLIKPLSLFTAVNSLGKEIDQGTLLRYLAEMAWFPQGAISPYLRWESIDDKRARVTMEYMGVSASGIFLFNDSGLVQAFEARRYGEFEGIYRKETWSVIVNDYKAFNGVTIGYHNEVTWKLKEGDFTWLRMEVTDIQPTDRQI